MIQTRIGPDMTVGDNSPLALIAGPCVLETPDLALEIAATCKSACEELGINYIFKASFDKANRTSGESFRGVGLETGLEILRSVGNEIGVPTLTDIHDEHQAVLVAETVDILQIPALLSRQTDLLHAAAAAGRAVNVKKGQFLAPWDMTHAVEKLREGGATEILVTERGTSFGYNALVVDFRSLVQMREVGVPVVFDATHSVQMPGALGKSSGGQAEFVRPLARAAAAVGIDALFLEVHPEPLSSPSDGPNMVRLSELASLLREVKAIHELRAG